MIWEKGLQLSDDERRRLDVGAMSQDRQIAMLFRGRPTYGFTFYDVVQATGFNQDSVKRSISNMAGSGDLDKYKDDYNRFPLLKTDKKKLNPETGISISVYTWNTRYNQPPTNREILKRHAGKQMDFHNK